NRVCDHAKKKGDDDTTTLCHLNQNVPYGVEKCVAQNRDIHTIGSKNPKIRYYDPVPPFTERPAKEYLSHDPDKTYQFVLFDIETTCTGKQAEICQLSAICQNVENENLVTVLVGHNAATFDVPTLLRNAGNNFEEQLHSMKICFGDSLPLIRSLISNQHAPLKQSNGQFCKANLASVYKCLFDQDFDAHDALEDVIALKRILFSPEMSIDVKTIVDRSQISSVRAMKSDMEFIDFRHDRYQTFVGNLHCPNEDHSPISHV
ncbi:exonuclease R569, partial [Paramuricea clavata]